MKEKLIYCLRWLRDGAMRVARMYPVEMLLALYFCVGCLVSYELDSDSFMPKLVLAPMFFIAALAVNVLAGRTAWRKLYWVCWLPIVPLSLWAGLELWLRSEPAWITLGILTPLALLLCTRALRNERFVTDVVIWLRSGVLALFFANVALALFAGILYSTTYIFGLHGSWIEHVMMWAMILTNAFAVPTLFLIMYDRWAGCELRMINLVQVLFNYLITPALLIYTAILYLYVAKILLTWTLPEGGVAYLVFGFTISTIIIKAIQTLLEKRIYDWFFDRFSLISLPMLVLFWVGVMRRIGEYGLTAPRVCLLVCGSLMTLCIVLFLFKRAGRYFYVCAAGFVVFAAMAYIPGFSPERIASRSQAARVERLARQLGRLDADGRLILTPASLADTVHIKEHHRLYEALNYISWRDTAALARLGIDTPQDYVMIFPSQMQNAVEYGPRYYDTDNGLYDSGTIEIRLPENTRYAYDAAYPHFYMNIERWNNGYSFDNNTLTIYLVDKKPAWAIPCDELLRRQLDRSGYDPASGYDPTDEQRLQLLDYRDEYCRIVFDNMDLERVDSTYKVRWLSIGTIMTR